MKRWRKSSLRKETQSARTSRWAGENDVKPNIEIVGVVKNAKEGHVRDADRPYFYQPYSQFGKLFGMSFYVRTKQEPLLIANAVRETVRGADANLPVYDLKTVERVVDEDLFAERVIAGLSAAFGGLAALLAHSGSTECWHTWWCSGRGKLEFAWRWGQQRGT